MSGTPKRIFGYWHQGRDAAPEPVRLCWDLWQRMNPDWDVIILEWADVEQRFREFGIDGDNMSLNGVANIVRIDRLAEQGGVWVDAYTVPLRPLDAWLPAWTPTGFFIFHDPYRKRLSENWFIASEAHHPLAVAWRDAMVDYWRTRRRPMRSRREFDPTPIGALTRLCGRLADLLTGPPSARASKRIFKIKNPHWAVSAEGGARFAIYPYFAIAMLFDNMIADDAELRAHFAAYPKFSSYDSLMLRHRKKDYARMDEQEVRSICRGKVMQKLNLKIKMPDHLLAVLIEEAKAHMPRA